MRLILAQVTRAHPAGEIHLYGANRPAVARATRTSCYRGALVFGGTTMQRSVWLTGFMAVPAAAIVFASGGAVGADTVGTASAVKAVIACRDVADSTQRLACYDKTVGDMAGADAKGDLITIDQEQRKTIRHQAFGFTMPSFTLFDKGEKPEEAKQASFKVTQAWQDLEHHWNFKLETGAVWRQTDDNELYHDPHAGSTAVITRGAMNGFFMKVDGQQAIRVMRVS